jgi:DNA-binding ferritin-like protein
MVKITKTNRNLKQRRRRKSVTQKKRDHNPSDTHSRSKTYLDIIRDLLQLQAQIKFLHWNTKVYSIHMVSDKFHEKLSGHIDELVEVLLAHGVKLQPVVKHYENTKDLSTHQTSHKNEKENTLHALNKVVHNINHNSKNAPRDISAILDVVVVDINRFKYLLSIS